MDIKRVETRGVACSAVKLMAELMAAPDAEQGESLMSDINVAISSYLAAPLAQIAADDAQAAVESTARAHALIVELAGVAGVAASLLRQRGQTDEWLVHYEMSSFSL